MESIIARALLRYAFHSEVGTESTTTPALAPLHRFKQERAQTLTQLGIRRERSFRIGQHGARQRNAIEAFGPFCCELGLGDVSGHTQATAARLARILSTTDL